MRPLALLLVAAGLAPAQDDAWAVARPQAKPEGEPIGLAWKLEPGWAHRIELKAKSDARSSVLGATEVEVGVTYRVGVVRRNEDDGSFDYEMPLEVTRLRVNGEDGLPHVADLVDDTRVTGRLDRRGRPVKGSLQSPDLPQVGDWLGNGFPPLPANPVRRGEVWDGKPGVYAARLGAGVEDEASGAVYHKLVDVARVDGAEVAVIETVFAIAVDGADALRVQGMSGKGSIRLRGRTVLHVGRDGYLRRSVTEIETEISLEGAPPLEVRSKDRIELTGTRERFEPAPDDDNR